MVRGTDRQNTEQDILEAAEAEFLEKGYNGTTTAAIAKRAGVTHAMLHYYFGTKENLFEVYLKKKVGMLKASLLPVVAVSDISFMEKVKVLIGKHLEFMVEHPELPEFAVKEMLFASPDRQELLRSEVLLDERVLRFKMEFESEVARGTVRNIPFVELLAELLSLNFAAMFILKLRETIFPDRDVHELIEAKKRENYEIIMNKLKIDR